MEDFNVCSLQMTLFFFLNPRKCKIYFSYHYFSLILSGNKVSFLPQMRLYAANFQQWLDALIELCHYVFIISRFSFRFFTTCYPSSFTYLSTSPMLVTVSFFSFFLKNECLVLLFYKSVRYLKLICLFTFD